METPVWLAEFYIHGYDVGFDETIFALPVI
jgi:hypothetical protein